ncbi:MAG: DUF2868 domain-containing protein, partial [Burkholderiales bacterium]|nr:DUF2868 domain-containing protein [Burkholderiales bacterium]
LGVYAVVLLRWIWAALGRPVVPGPIRRAVGRLGHATLAPVGGRREAALTRALTAFASDWTHASMPLAAARIGRALHLAALAFALGVLAGMYIRGMVLEYRAGWESTFLDAHAVRTLLQVILGPASHLTGIALPDAVRLEAMRFGAGIGENAAPWLHLYAVTIALFVLLPRAALAGLCGLIAYRKAHRFLSADDDIYARRLVRQLRGDAAQVHVLPYAVDLAPAARDGLLSLMARVYGAKAAVEIAPSVAWGTEEALSTQAMPAGIAALWALFALAATPERENHGVFLRALRERGAGTTPLLALVDESAFRKRFADTPTRLAERRAAWQSLLDECQVGAVFVDLEGIDLVAAENAMNAALERVVQAGS